MHTPPRPALSPPPSAPSPTETLFPFEAYKESKKEKVRREGRELLSASLSMLAYWSQGRPEANTNGAFKDEAGVSVVCRMYAFRFSMLEAKAGTQEASAPSKHRYQRVFSEQSEVSADYFLDMNKYDDDRTEFRANRYYSFSLNIDNAFGQALAEECKALRVGEERHFSLSSENHGMQIIVCKKQQGEKTYYAVKFFDPNATLVHRRVVCERLEELGRLSLSDFLTPTRVQAYFPRFKSGVLAVYEDPNHLILEKDRPKSVTDLTASTSRVMTPDDIYYACKFGFSDSLRTLFERTWVLNSHNKILLACKDSKGASPFSLAMFSGHLETVKLFMEQVLNSKLSLSEKSELLRGTYNDGTTALMGALLERQEKTIEVYLKAVLDSDLPSEEKIKILSLKNNLGMSPLVFAMTCCPPAIVTLFMETVLNSKLSSGEKFQLLRGDWDEDEQPALIPTIRRYRHLESSAAKAVVKEVIQAYIETLCNSDLPPREKVHLFSEVEKAVPSELRQIAVGILENTKAITWATVHWIGLAYTPSRLWHNSKHDVFAEQMIGQRAPPDAEDAVEYLRTVYEGCNKASNLAKSIEKVFEKCGQTLRPSSPSAALVFALRPNPRASTDLASVPQ